MLEAFAIFFLAMACLNGLLLILGLIKPVLALWYLDRFNRLKVIKVHASMMGIFLLLWFLVACI